ncbi:MAG: hypothetical protein C4289_17810, partial [Chloroflexota bacterium]
MKKIVCSAPAGALKASERCVTSIPIGCFRFDSLFGSPSQYLTQVSWSEIAFAPMSCRLKIVVSRTYASSGQFARSFG